MTQQQSKRDAQEDINYLKNSHKQDVLEVTVQTIGMADYWIKEAESQRIRAEAAEQERDKLIENISVLLEASGAMAFESVAEMLNKMRENENRKLRKEAEVQRIRAEAAERKSEQLLTSLEMITDSFQQFKKSVSLLETQVVGYTTMHSEREG